MIDLVKKIKAQELWGEEAHRLYSPPYRPVYTYDEILQRNPKQAAVNILFYLKDGEWYFPLMLRSKNIHDTHSGQVSLPGGQYEEGDLSFEETAIRETNEEMGIDRHYIHIIRRLSPIYVQPSNFYVHTFISYTKRNPIFKLQKSEAVELIEFPVSELLIQPEPPTLMELPSEGNTEVPAIRFKNHIIWGATSMILSELRHLLKNL